MSELKDSSFSGNTSMVCTATRIYVAVRGPCYKLGVRLVSVVLPQTFVNVHKATWMSMVCADTEGHAVIRNHAADRGRVDVHGP